MESGLSLFSICGLGDLLHPLCSAKDSTGCNNSSFPVRNKIAAECPSPRKPAWNLRFRDPTCVDTCYQRQWSRKLANVAEEHTVTTDVIREEVVIGTGRSRTHGHLEDSLAQWLKPRCIGSETPGMGLAVLFNKPSH